MINNRVSVILPTYNREKTIIRAVRSVLRQTFADFELIIIDDCSTDNTGLLVNTINDDRIKYFKSESNLGGGGARNLGVKLSKGDLITFQDSDDEWHPEKLEKQVQLFDSTPSSHEVIYTSYVKLDLIKRSTLYIPNNKTKQKEGNLVSQLCKGNFIGTPTILVKKEALLKVGAFDPRLPMLQDWDLVLKLAKNYSFGFIDEPLVTAYVMSDSITSVARNRYIALEIIIKKHFDMFRFDKSLLSNYYFSLGHYYCSKMDTYRGRPYFVEALKLTPFAFKPLVCYFISIFGKKIYNLFRRHKLS